jgi:hypothetical protein
MVVNLRRTVLSERRRPFTTLISLPPFITLFVLFLRTGALVLGVFREEGIRELLSGRQSYQCC